MKDLHDSGSKEAHHAPLVLRDWQREGWRDAGGTTGPPYAFNEIYWKALHNSALNKTQNIGLSAKLIWNRRGRSIVEAMDTFFATMMLMENF